VLEFPVGAMPTSVDLERDGGAGFKPLVSKTSGFDSIRDYTAIPLGKPFRYRAVANYANAPSLTTGICDAAMH